MNESEKGEMKTSNKPMLIDLNLKRKKNKETNKNEIYQNNKSEISDLLFKLQNQTAVVKNISIPSTERESYKDNNSKFNIIDIHNRINKEKEFEQSKNTRYDSKNLHGERDELHEKKEQLNDSDEMKDIQKKEDEENEPEAYVNKQKDYFIKDIEELIDEKAKPFLKAQIIKELDNRNTKSINCEEEEHCMKNISKQELMVENSQNINEIKNNEGTSQKDDNSNENKVQSPKLKTNMFQKENQKFDFDVNEIEMVDEMDNDFIEPKKSKKESEFEFDVLEIEQKGLEKEEKLQINDDDKLQEKEDKKIQDDKQKEHIHFEEDNIEINKNRNQIYENSENNDANNEDDNNGNNKKESKAIQLKVKTSQNKNLQNSSIEELGEDNNKKNFKDSNAKNNNTKSKENSVCNINREDEEASKHSEGGFNPEIKELDSNNDQNDIQIEIEPEHNPKPTKNKLKSTKKKKEAKLNKDNQKQNFPKPKKEEEPSLSMKSNKKDEKPLTRDSNSKLASILNNIKAYDFNHPKLTDKYEFIETFIQNEPSLLNSIPKFDEEIITPEGNSSFLKRRQGYLSGKILESSFVINNLLLEQLQNCKEPYKTKLETNYEKTKPDLSSPSNKLLSSFKLSSTSTSVGQIENIEAFCIKYNASKNTQFMQKIIDSFNYWRPIISDGNSLYRVFMLGIIEDCILNKKEKELSMLTNEIIIRSKQESSSLIFKRLKIKIDSSIIILKGIINYLKENNIPLAYDLLYQGYHLNDNSFDYTLIAYLRSVVLEYLKEVYDLIEKEASKNNQHINPDEKDNIDSIGYLGIEGGFFLLCVCSFLFNVNITFVWVDGDLMKPRTNIMKIEDPEAMDLPMITLGYVYSHYIKVYPNQLNSIFNSIILEIPKEDIGIKKLVYIQADKKEYIDCSLCKKKSPKVYFIQKKFSACLECVISHIDKILTQRAMTFALTNFISLECKTIIKLH